MFIQAETTLRSLILKNQEVVDKWTHRQTCTMDEIVAVKFVSAEIVKVDVEVPKIMFKYDPDAKVKLIKEERDKIVQNVREEYLSRIDELEANILAY